MSQSEIVAAMAAESSRIEEDALYSSRGHFKAAVRWNRVHLWTGLPLALLAGIGGYAALKENPIFAGVTGLCVGALTAANTFLNPSQKGQAHHTAGTRFNGLRNNARMFREIILIDEQRAGEWRGVLEELAKRRDELNEASPPIPQWAFLQARKSIEDGEATHRVDVSGKRSLP